MPAALIIFAHFSVSSPMNFSNSAGEIAKARSEFWKARCRRQRLPPAKRWSRSQSVFPPLAMQRLMAATHWTSQLSRDLPR
jgi:hypothetical protein